jgi:hypothetical protein
MTDEDTDLAIPADALAALREGFGSAFSEAVASSRSLSKLANAFRRGDLPLGLARRTGQILAEQALAVQGLSEEEAHRIAEAAQRFDANMNIIMTSGAARHGGFCFACSFCLFGRG